MIFNYRLRNAINRKQSRTTESRAKPLFLTAGEVVKILSKRGELHRSSLAFNVPLSLTAGHSRLQPITPIVVLEVGGLY